MARKYGKNGAASLDGFSLEELQAAVKARKHASTGLAKRRAKLVAQLAAIDAEIGGDSSARPQTAPKVVRNGRRAGRKAKAADGAERNGLAAATLDVLAASEEPMGVPAIAAKLRAGSYKKAPKSFTVMLSQRLSALTKARRVVRVERGVYQLKS